MNHAYASAVALINDGDYGSVGLEINGYYLPLVAIYLDESCHRALYLNPCLSGKQVVCNANDLAGYLRLHFAVCYHGTCCSTVSIEMLAHQQSCWVAAFDAVRKCHIWLDYMPVCYEQSILDALAAYLSHCPGFLRRFGLNRPPDW